ncbi:ARM repeat-containing protein [Ramaria rubella]|nr:ARM repeat-containing protein [Ramaria rubella]
MGNTLSGPTATRAGGALDSFVSELGSDILYDKSLGSSRFLKTVKCNHRNGALVVKIFIKSDPGLNLRTYARRLKSEREALLDIPNVYNYQVFVENDRAGYIVRQWLEGSLYDRISTRPFLSIIEKKWIAFQLLNGMRDARKRNIPHGDIKSENVLVTSWNWIYLTDFASFKPTFLPLDDPADFSFFFDTSGRRTCYIAPERFFTAGSDISKKKATLDFDKRDGKVTESMDVFSLGCVIAELFLEGTAMFTLSQLFKYRAGELNLENHLSAVEDEDIRALILRMVALEPAHRPTFDTALHTSRGTAFPECFYSFLHNYVSSVNELSPASIFTKQLSATPHAEGLGSSEPIPLPSDSDHRIDSIWTDYESVEPFLVAEAIEETVTEVKKDPVSNEDSLRRLYDLFPVVLYIPNRDSKLEESSQRAAPEDGPALIMLSLVCANIRNCSLPSSKVKALDILLALSSHLTDEAKLDRLAPYVIDLLHDEVAIVRGAALRTLVQLLMLVNAITPSNAPIFPEYIFPNIRYLYKDSDVSVRCILAQCVAPLADTSLRYLEMGQAMKAHGTFKLANTQEYDDALYEVSYDASLQDLQTSIQDLLVALLVDSSSVVKRAVLHNVSSLCIFLGRQKTNDVLLGHMITYLNDRDWILRYAFFESIVDVAACVGGRSLEEYIFPLMVQALSDEEETVVARVLGALTSLSELGLFQRMRLWELMSATLGFLYHPNMWIREGASAFIASATKHLPPTDVWCILYPSLKHFLRSDVRSITEQSLLLTLKNPLSRQIFDAAVVWAMKADKTHFWKSQSTKSKSYSPKSETAKEGLSKGRKPGGSRPPPTEEDELNIAKLQKLGMTAGDEAKLLALRDYMIKLANVISSFATRAKESDPETLAQTNNGVELQKLGVVPQTVFVGVRPSDSSRSGSSRRSAIERHGRGTVHGSPRMARTSSTEHLNHFDDLRRRLAVINGSSSSLSHLDREPRASSSSARPTSAVASTGPDSLATRELRPPSPTDSVVSSAVDGSSLRPRALLQVGGPDGPKAPAAVGSIKANAIGLLEAPAVPRLGDDELVVSGRSSPVSNAGTLRAERRSSLQSGRPFSLTFEPREPGIYNLLEQLYYDTSREALHDFGPKVHEGPIRRRNTPRQSSFFMHESNRRSEAALIANLASHAGPVNGIVVAPDHTFFVTCSDDKTVKVWDTARLERNVTSKPRQTYSQHHARVTAVCMLQGLHCFASAGDDGSLHVVRVHVSLSGSLPKYSKLQVVREHRVDQIGEYITCLSHFNTESASNIIYATTHATIVVLDLRTMRILQTMENPRHYGPILALCIDRRMAWLLVGTITGVLTLWDLRFGLLIKSWRAGVGVPGRSLRIHKCIVHPTKGRGRWVMVALEARPPSHASSSPVDSRGIILVEVWDIETTALVETYETREGLPEPPTAIDQTDSPPPYTTVVGQEAEKSPAVAIAALVRSRTAVPENGTPTTIDPDASEPTRQSPAWTQPDVCALIGGSDFAGLAGAPGVDYNNLDRMGETEGKTVNPRGGFIITGSEDRKIRLWDLNRVERSVVLTGGDIEGERANFATIRTPTKTALVHVETSGRHGGGQYGNQNQRAASRTNLITHHQQSLLKAHQDCITALACIDSPFRGGIVSGDRAGVVKIWRVEEVQ